jgi:thiamine kinase-like enzyme
LKIRDVFDHLSFYYYSCYNLQNEEIIIMQDLKVEGYCTHDRKLPMSMDQVRHVVKMYTRYHVLSFATRAMKPDNFLELTYPLKNTLKSIVMSQVLNEEKFFDDLRKLALEKNELEVDKKLGLLFHLNDYIDGKGRFMVVIHGDCEPGNFLFKYEVSGSGCWF